MEEHNGTDQTKENRTVLVDAKRIAEEARIIVDQGMEQEDFPAMDKGLKGLSNDREQKERYVFEDKEINGRHILMLISILIAIIFVLFCCLSLGILFYSVEFVPHGIVGMLVSILVIAINVIFVRYLVITERFYKRYNIYKTLLEHSSIELVMDLMNYANNFTYEFGDEGNKKSKGITTDIIVKDLCKAVRQKLIPQGHFGTENIIFMTSDEVYMQYENNREAYDIYYKDLAEKRMLAEERPKELQDTRDMIDGYVKKIRGYNELIPGEEISRKLDKLESIIKMIYYELDINPWMVNDFADIMQCYLSMTEKLLDRYIEIDKAAKEMKAKSLESISLKESLGYIENSIDDTNYAFENILEQFYQAKKDEIMADALANQFVMRQDGML